jgi:hypothetical protein
VVEEFCVFLSLFEPLNAIFLSPENFFMFVSLFQLPFDVFLLLLLSCSVPGLDDLHLKGL